MSRRQRRHKCAVTHQELLASAVRLQPLLRENTFASESMRRLPDEVVDGLTSAGFFRLLKPQRCGGYDVNQRTVLEIIEILGQANRIGGMANEHRRHGRMCGEAWAGTGPIRDFQLA